MFKTWSSGIHRRTPSSRRRCRVLGCVSGLGLRDRDSSGLGTCPSPLAQGGTPQTTCSLLPVTAACGVEKLVEPIADPETAHNNPRQSEVTFCDNAHWAGSLREPAQCGGFFYSGVFEVSTQPSLWRCRESNPGPVRPNPAFYVRSRAIAYRPPRFVRHYAVTAYSLFIFLTPP